MPDPTVKAGQFTVMLVPFTWKICVLANGLASVLVDTGLVLA